VGHGGLSAPGAALIDDNDALMPRQYLLTFSPRGHAVGINAVLDALTH
jgi:hypothetical protein